MVFSVHSAHLLLDLSELFLNVPKALSKHLVLSHDSTFDQVDVVKRLVELS